MCTGFIAGARDRLAHDVVLMHGCMRSQVERIHTHIGSGSDPAVWQRVSGMSINLCRAFPDVSTLNLGGGFKVGRMAYEKVRQSTQLS